MLQVFGNILSHLAPQNEKITCKFEHLKSSNLFSQKLREQALEIYVLLLHQAEFISTFICKSLFAVY